MSYSTSTVAQRRKRRQQDSQREEEDATKLYFGPEFDATQLTHDGNVAPLIALNLSEARLLINAALSQRRKDNAGESAANGESGEAFDDEDQDFVSGNEVLRKTQQYLASFAQFRDEQTVSAVEHLLKSPENADLHPFEIAQLGTLALDDAEEAKTLIPSLSFKKTDEDLQVLLDHLRRFA